MSLVRMERIDRDYAAFDGDLLKQRTHGRDFAEVVVEGEACERRDGCEVD